MSREETPSETAPDSEPQEPAVEAETGARHPSGHAATLLLGVPLSWSLFQLWYVSPLPFALRFGVFNDTEARSIHLAFAVFLAFTAFPALKRSPRSYIPLQDWVFALVGAFCAAYLYLFYEGLADRSGAPIGFDLAVGLCGLVLLLEATRRALGPPLMVVAGVFLLYSFAGPWMPDVIAHKGASLHKAMSHYWLGTEGVFGVALGVSTSFVFLFVLFGALLERAGAGHYFIQVAFSLLGHLRGGPAKAAVISSAATGLISGSSIANVVTTGTFTIPLMKRVGFSAIKAGAVEVASSTNGQLTPPIMGAAAFLMVEYVGISYIEVIQHAILPAAISYIALVYIVHLEALKAGMQGLPQRVVRTPLQRLFTFVSVVLGVCLLSLALYYGMAWLKGAAGAATIYIAGAFVVASYVALVKYAAGYPELEMDDPNAEILELPEAGPTVKSGLHYLLPVVVLIWCLTVERLSPGLSAFWATVFMMFIVVTQRPLFVLFRRRGELNTSLVEGLVDLREGLISGARNMVGIGVATAAAGIVVGTVTLTGIGLVMTEFVEFISAGNVMLMLIFTAIICLLLGMGLPTTANYIVVSTLMAPVIVTLGAEAGLIVPLVAVHMFVFYFGILADDTPPVGLAAFAASAIAQSDPIRTGLQGFAYDIRTAILPFLFIFNTQLLLIGIGSGWELLLTITSALAAMLIFAAATQGWWLTKSRLWESLALVLVAFALFRPGFFWDEIFPPIEQLPVTQIEAVAAELPDGGELQLVAEGETLSGELKRRTVSLPLAGAGSGVARLERAGLLLRSEGDQLWVDSVAFGSAAEQVGLEFDWRIVHLQRATDRPAKQWVFLPALALLGLIGLLQRRRVAA